MNSDLTHPDLSAVFAAMSVRDLQRELRERGVNTASCIEKADLVQLLASTWVAPTPQPAARSAAAGGAIADLQGLPGALKYSCQTCGRADGYPGNDAGGKLLKCGKCNGAHYCCRKCQVADWPAHKLQCQKIQIRNQRFASLVGTEVAAAYGEWAKRFKPLIWEAAAAVLWPAPHFFPRNRSHGLLLHVSCHSSSRPPRFNIERFEVLTLEEMGAWMVRGNGGEAFQWPAMAPDPDPRSETMKVVVVFARTVRGMQLNCTGPVVLKLKDGSWNLPTAEETIAKINALA